MRAERAEFHNTKNGHPAAGLSVALDVEALKPLVRAIVAEVLDQLRVIEAQVPDKLAFGEQEAARLIGLNSWQLRDERLRGRIAASGIVGKRVRYVRSDLVRYLMERRLAVT
jgi:hypothetical protein